MKKLEGLYPALITPFDKEGKVNTTVLQKLVASLMKKGANGFYVCGSTAESYLLSVDERKKVLEAVKEVTGYKVDVIANIGMFSTEHGIYLAKHAQNVGVSAISSVPPFYFPFKMEEYIQYYNDLANAVDVPVIVYNIPAMSSVNFTTRDLEILFKNKSIIGVKHTSYDLFQLQQILEMYPEKSIFIGHDEIFLSALSVGVKAGIGSTYNIMFEKFMEINQLFQQHKMEEALKVQNEINNIVVALSRVGVFKGVKAILEMQGFDCGICRKPFLPLTKEQIQYLRTVAEENGIL